MQSNQFLSSSDQRNAEVQADEVSTTTVLVELDAAVLSQIGGGLLPNGTWSVAVTSLPNGTW